MTWIANIRARLNALLHRRELEEEFDAELAHHLAMKRRDLEQQSGASAAAHFASLRAFGNTARWKEETRSLWRFETVESFFSDAAYALRVLRKDRLFTLVAVVTLTLGIGANAAIFSLLDALLWRPLPVPHPEQLVRLAVTHLPPSYRLWVNGRPVAPTERQQMTYAMYQALTEHQQGFAGMFAIIGGGQMELDLNGVPSRVYTLLASGSFFPVLGLRAQAGRLLTPDDDLVDGPARGWLAVISDGLWSQLFARSPRAIGARYQGEPARVIRAVEALFQNEAGRLPYTQVWTLRGNLAESLGSERLLTWLLGGFAAFALLISVTGLAGLLSYAVEQRRKELGIRMALGATPRRIRREIRWQGLSLTSAGLAGGALLSYGLHRSLNAYLFGVGPADPRIWAAGAVALLAAALAATALPAWRAGRVDPSRMLREE